MPSSWSNNLNKGNLTSALGLTRLFSMLGQQRRWNEVFEPGSTAVQEGTYFCALASPGAVIFTIKPVARTCWDSRTSRTLPSGNPGLRHHWHPSWDDSARPLGRYQSNGLLSVGLEQHPNQRSHWSTRMSRMGVWGVSRDHTERRGVGRGGGEGHTAFH